LSDGDGSSGSRDDADSFLRAVAASPPQPPPETPTRIAHFRILGELGRGGMGVVYRAEDESLRRTVALKLLPSASGDPERRLRFLREARSAAAISHPNVAVVHQVGEADGRVYIAMELIEGESLRARLDHGRLDVATAKQLATQIAQGLAAAHDKGIVHRDLKPENVMITPAGIVKLLDFGLAKTGVDTPLLGKTETALAKTETLVTSDDGRVMGTPEYMSPEQALSDPLDVRSDVFSFGIVFYEMLCGKRPFAGASAGAVLVAVATARPPPLRDRAPDVDAATDAVVARCLSKERGARFANAEGIVAAMLGPTAPSTASSSGSAVATAGSGPVEGARRRRPWLLGLALLGIVGVGAGWLLSSRHRASAVVPAPSTNASAGPVDDAMQTSSNPEAQRLFEEALRSYHDGSGQAVPKLQRAVELDPSFGAALVRLWFVLEREDPVWGGVDAHLEDLTREYKRRIVMLAGSLSRRDRALFDSLESDDVGVNRPRLDAYLERYPDDDVAWWARVEVEEGAAVGPRALAMVDRALAADPTFAPMLATKAGLLFQSHPDEAMALVEKCLALSPPAASCLTARAWLLGARGDCAAAETDIRRWLVLAPESLDARGELADLLAARSEPAEAISTALGSSGAGQTHLASFGMYLRDTAVPFLEGNFDQVVEIARDRATTVASSTTAADHELVATAIVVASTEAGDLATAGRAARDYLSRRAAWDYSGTVAGLMIRAAARAGLLSDPQARSALDGEFRRMLKAGQSRLMAWAQTYVWEVRSPKEARAAVAVLDTLHANLDELPAFPGATAETLFLAGRGAEARPLLELVLRPCTSQLGNSPLAMGSHLYLGILDEQAGNKTSACNHFAKVLESWGHAKPRSVTADEARVHAKALACSL
jgi:serine/threonine protein kinase